MELGPHAGVLRWDLQAEKPDDVRGRKSPGELQESIVLAKTVHRIV